MGKRKCSDCGTVFSDSRSSCPKCYSESYEELSKSTPSELQESGQTTYDLDMSDEKTIKLDKKRLLYLILSAAFFLIAIIIIGVYVINAISIKRSKAMYLYVADVAPPDKFWYCQAVGNDYIGINNKKFVLCASIVYSLMLLVMASVLLLKYLNKCPRACKSLVALNIVLLFVMLFDIFNRIPVFISLVTMAFYSNKDFNQGVVFPYLFKLEIILMISMLIFTIVLGKTKFEGDGSMPRPLKSNGALFDGFKIIEDDMTGITKYVHPRKPIYCFNRGFLQSSNLGLSISFKKTEGINSFFICLDYSYKYSGEKMDWFFLESFVFKTDNSRYSLSLDQKPIRNHDSKWVGNNLYDYYVEEGSQILSTRESIKMFEDICTSNTLKVRLEGDQIYEDFVLNKNHRKLLLDAYNAYCKAQDHVYNPDKDEKE